MLIDTSKLAISQLETAKAETPVSSNFNQESTEFISKRELLTKHIGKLRRGKETHFYSWANFNIVRLIVHLLEQTGPVHLLMTSYSFSQKSIEQLKRKKEQGLFLSIRLIVDNRVRVMSPKPFQMLSECFDYRCISVHAKVILLWNKDWQITIVTSQNATNNPKLERGVIYTDPKVFDFDFKVLDNEFKQGTT